MISRCLPVLVGALLLGSTACGDGGGGARATVSDVRLEPSEANHLAATLRFSTSAPVRPRVEVIGETGIQVVPDSGFVGGREARTEHEVRILGLRAERDHRIRIGGSSLVADESLSHRPGPLPQGFPRIDVTIRDEARMEPGYTVVGLNRLVGGGSWIVVLDGEGVPVWYHRFSTALSGVLAHSSGHFVGVSTRWDHFEEIGPLGDRLRSVDGPDLGVDTVHHEVSEGRDGHLLVLSSELVQIDGYPEGRLDVVGDILVEMHPDGTVVDRWHLLDVLDPRRMLADARIPFWNGVYTEADALRDWSHINSVFYRADRDSFVMSSLNQQIVFEMSRAGELVWVIGADHRSSPDDDDWPWLRLEGPGRFPVRQHGVAVSESGTVLVYDNDFDTLMSRGVEYEIDVEAGVARQVFSWRDPEVAVFSPIGGDHDPLPNGNVLITDPVVLSRGLVERVVEVERSSREKVFEVYFPGSGGFNAHRIPSLYP